MIIIFFKKAFITKVMNLWCKFGYLNQLFSVFTLWPHNTLLMRLYIFILYIRKIPTTTRTYIDIFFLRKQSPVRRQASGITEF